MRCAHGFPLPSLARHRGSTIKFQGRLLTVVYTLRDGAVRIISARKSTQREANDYARGI
ncbi:MAG: BrnT family toxin [Pseudomonadota bacterium]